MATGRNMEKLSDAFANLATDELLLEPLDVTSEADQRVIVTRA